MQTQLPQIQFQLTPDANIPEEIQAEAEQIAKEAYVMTRLKHGIISSGRRYANRPTTLSRSFSDRPRILITKLVETITYALPKDKKVVKKSNQKQTQKQNS